MLLALSCTLCIAGAAPSLPAHPGELTLDQFTQTDEAPAAKTAPTLGVTLAQHFVGSNLRTLGDLGSADGEPPPPPRDDRILWIVLALVCGVPLLIGLFYVIIWIIILGSLAKAETAGPADVRPAFAGVPVFRF